MRVPHRGPSQWSLSPVAYGSLFSSSIPCRYPDTVECPAQPNPLCAPQAVAQAPEISSCLCAC